MSLGARETVPSPFAADPAHVARALNGLSESILSSWTQLAERVAQAEGELATLRAGENAASEGASAAARQQATRFAAVAAGIAHELRTPLSSARGFSELLARHLPGGCNEQRWALRVLESLLEAEELCASLFALATGSAPRRDAIEPAELFEEALGAVRRLGLDRPGCERWSIDADVRAPRFAGDRARLRLALRCMVTATLLAQTQGARVFVRIALDGAWIDLCVRDESPTQPNAAPARPENTSLQLARAIAELHGGTLLDGRNAHGSEISLRIPYETP